MALILDNLSKRFGGVVASENVNITVPKGKITGLIGPNGAGKTTIVNMITGMLAVSGGTIRVDDTDITRAPADQICRAGLARTFQNIRILPENSVLDNILIGFHRHERCSTLSALLGLPASRRETAAMRARAEALLERFGMRHLAEYPAGGLSYGHQRRVEMMRALASEPEYILLDEPIAGMNDVESDALAVLFRDLADSGIGILLIEHNLRFVTRLCQHIYVLDGGRLIAEGAPEAVLSDPAVLTAYVGGEHA
ncbi:ABC transporter ATP-binding protein [Pararhodobacter aggregans]|uniref:ABC transporter ATP-binding protein n=1 Tax=Pararhodobacter aggregans TaxID=404875 RepID=A0A2T7UX12_9RHOB|nr:ABC transporter ATP-binding protein [Pararhodobacter aggregans]PTX04785.1 amino acid/amide ABC transporter ATP-binding protein 1 (HAAT family) [Pararhodobacter aggregans]PVE49116.1 ABC transporter ATP-binding protein [Pararhodobacter aggregans]